MKLTELVTSGGCAAKYPAARLQEPVVEWGRSADPVHKLALETIGLEKRFRVGRGRSSGRPSGLLAGPAK